MDDPKASLTKDEITFCEALAADPLLHTRRAAKLAGHKNVWAWRKCQKPEVRRYIEHLVGKPWAEIVKRQARARKSYLATARLTADQAIATFPTNDPRIASPLEILIGLTQEARSSMGEFLEIDEGCNPDLPTYHLDVSKGVRAGFASLIKEFREETWVDKAGCPHRRVHFRLYDAHEARVTLSRIYGLDDEANRKKTEEQRKTMEEVVKLLPPELVVQIHLALLRQGQPIDVASVPVPTNGKGQPHEPEPTTEWEA